MKTIEKIRKGVLALYHDGKVSELASALNIVWPGSIKESGDFIDVFKKVSMTDLKFYVKSDTSDCWSVTMYFPNAITVTEFLREYRAWEDKQIETKRPEKPEEVAKDQHKAFEPKSGIFSGIGNPKPEDIHVGGPNSIYTPDPEYLDKKYNEAIELLKKAASNMGKTIKVELEDKVKFRIKHIETNQEPRKRWFSVSMSDFGQNDQKMYDVFLEKHDRIIKAIEDILNEEQV